MSNPSPFGGRAARQFPTLPKGETVASFETYQEAQAAVDKLAKAAFPVKELSIVGTDLTSVERITGVLTWGRAAGAGDGGVVGVGLTAAPVSAPSALRSPRRQYRRR